MSADRYAASALNCLSLESFHFLGNSDGSALADFLQGYFCGDDPTDDYSGKIVLIQCTFAIAALFTEQ